MPVIPLNVESQNQQGFYVPQFEIRIEGVGLPRNVLRDVVQCTYKDSIKEIDSIELTVNNWDADLNNFKYVGAETAETMEKGSDSENVLHKLFEPCGKEVQVHMGYSGVLKQMMIGTFTTMEPSFPNSGGPTLQVRGLNVLHQLRRRQYTKAWRNKKHSEIAEAMAELRDGSGKRRFPIPIRTDDNAKEKEENIPYIAQRNQYDIDFLLARARELDYVVVVCEDAEESERYIYFGPSSGVPHRRDATFELTWGKSLMEFKPTLTTANQVKSVTVKGWNRRNGRAISETVSIDDQRSMNRCNRQNRDLIRLIERCNPREEHVVDMPVYTVGQARGQACAILANRQKQMVKARGTTVGLPDLRSGQQLRITNVGARFSGTYFVTETTHTINDSGYITRFKAHRETPFKARRENEESE